MYFLPRIQQHRNKKGWTQNYVAEKMNIKQSQYSRYESGEDEMRIGTFVNLCKALEVSADYLLAFSDDPQIK